MIPKKEETLILIMDHNCINQELLCKVYPLHTIVNNNQKIQYFQFMNILYLSIGLYRIKPSPQSKDMQNIGTKFGKFH